MKKRTLILSATAAGLVLAIASGARAVETSNGVAINGIVLNGTVANGSGAAGNTALQAVRLMLPNGEEVVLR